MARCTRQSPCAEAAASNGLGAVAGRAAKNSPGMEAVRRRFDVRRMTAEYERLYLGLDDAAGRLRAGVNVPAGANAG